MSGFLGKIGLCRSSSRLSGRGSSSSRADSDMDIDERAPPLHPSIETVNILMDDKNLKLRGHEEKKKFKDLKDQEFGLTPAYDPQLLQDTGMDVEFGYIFFAVGWSKVRPINDDVFRLLTIKFLCTLQFTNPGVEFIMFNKKFSLTWRQLSNLFGFDGDCVLDIDSVIPEYNKEQFSKEISNFDYVRKPKTNDIELPTLRFMHRWIAMTLFPRVDPHMAKEDELNFLYAMVKRQKVSPVVYMMHQWLDVFGPVKGAVECTSFVTYLATKLDLMENCLVQKIPRGQTYLTFEYFRQA
jgi:hypothetical protein